MTQADLQLQCNLYQNGTAVFPRNRKKQTNPNPKYHNKPKKKKSPPKVQEILRKHSKAEGFARPYLQLQHKVTVMTTAQCWPRSRRTDGRPRRLDTRSALLPRAQGRAKSPQQPVLGNRTPTCPKQRNWPAGHAAPQKVSSKRTEDFSGRPDPASARTAPQPDLSLRDGFFGFFWI